MKIKISYVSYLDIKGVKNNSRIDIEESTTIADLLDNLWVKKDHQRFIIPVVNGKERKLSYVLKQDDSLFLHLPAGGG